MRETRHKGGQPGYARSLRRRHPFGWRTALGGSQPLALQRHHCTFQPRAGGGVNAVAVKESLNGMLRSPGLSHELPKWKPSCSEDEPSIAGPSLGRLVPVILDRPGVFENTDIFTFLAFSLNLFPDKDKGFHCLNGASHQESARIGIARFSIGGEGLVFGMKVMTPNNTRKLLGQ